MSVADALRERLEALHERTRETPLFNPVFQLSLDISRRLEGGEIDLRQIAAMGGDVSPFVPPQVAERLAARFASRS